jgi:hypothetical protein
VGLIPILERKPTDSQPVTWVKDRLANPKSLSFRAKSKIDMRVTTDVMANV